MEIEINEEALRLGIRGNKAYGKPIPPSFCANCKQATWPSKEGRHLARATPAAAAVLAHVTRVGYIAKWQLGTSKGTSRRQQLHLKSNWPHHPPPRTHGLPHACHLSQKGAVCEVTVTTPLFTLLLQVQSIFVGSGMQALTVP